MIRWKFCGIGCAVESGEMGCASKFHAVSHLQSIITINLPKEKLSVFS